MQAKQIRNLKKRIAYNFISENWLKAILILQMYKLCNYRFELPPTNIYNSACHVIGKYIMYSYLLDISENDHQPISIYT